MAEKDTAEKLKNEAEAAVALAEKPLPTLAQPTVQLPEQIRQAVAIRCRETKESFSIKSSKMWVDLLKLEKRIPIDLKIDFTLKRGGFAGMKEKIEAKDATIAELEKKLAALQARKG